MAGILKCDQVQSDSNLAFAIAGSNVAFMNATSLQMVGSNVSLAGTNVFTSGKLVTAAQPVGAVLQVVQANTTTQVVVSTSTYTDTGLSASITPTSATSKILVLVAQNFYASAPSGGTGGGIKLLRGSIDIYNPSPSDTNGPYSHYISTTSYYTVINMQYLDSPATTSSITYKTQGKMYSASSSQVVTFQTNGSSTSAISSMILMEIAA